MVGNMSQWAPDIADYEGQRSALVIPGRNRVHVVHLDVQDCNTLRAFMIVDLSDTVNWPHEHTGHIHVDSVHMHFNPDPSFSGDISLAWLSNVDETDGEAHVIHTWHFDQDRLTMTDHLLWDWIQALAADESWFGPTFAASALFRTGFNLQGPDGQIAYASGDGDLVLRVGRTAGTIDIGITVSYATDP